MTPTRTHQHIHLQASRKSLFKQLGELESMTECPEKLHTDMVAMLQSVDANLIDNKNYQARA